MREEIWIRLVRSSLALRGRWYALVHLERSLSLLCLLILPAFAHDITGQSFQTDNGTGTLTFVFKQDGERLTGTYSSLFGTAQVVGSVKGDNIEFLLEVTVRDQKGKIVNKGKIERAKQIEGPGRAGGSG